MNDSTRTDTATFLDRLLPLKDASHAEVEYYGVDVPMRYSECFARLVDGRVVRLRDGRQFLGWTGMNGGRRLLFGNGEARIELRTRSEQGTVVRELEGIHRYIGRDGGMRIHGK